MKAALIIGVFIFQIWSAAPYPYSHLARMRGRRIPNPRLIYSNQNMLLQGKTRQNTEQRKRVGTSSHFRQIHHHTKTSSRMQKTGAAPYASAATSQRNSTQNVSKVPLLSLMPPSNQQILVLTSNNMSSERFKNNALQSREISQETSTIKNISRVERGSLVGVLFQNKIKPETESNPTISSNVGSDDQNSNVHQYHESSGQRLRAPQQGYDPYRSNQPQRQFHSFSFGATAPRSLPEERHLLNNRIHQSDSRETIHSNSGGPQSLPSESSSERSSAEQTDQPNSLSQDRYQSNLAPYRSFNQIRTPLNANQRFPVSIKATKEDNPNSFTHSAYSRSSETSRPRHRDRAAVSFPSSNTGKSRLQQQRPMSYLNNNPHSNLNSMLYSQNAILRQQPIAQQNFPAGARSRESIKRNQKISFAGTPALTQNHFQLIENPPNPMENPLAAVPNYGSRGLHPSYPAIHSKNLHTSIISPPEHAIQESSLHYQNTNTDVQNVEFGASDNNLRSGSDESQESYERESSRSGTPAVFPNSQSELRMGALNHRNTFVAPHQPDNFNQYHSNGPYRNGFAHNNFYRQGTTFQQNIYSSDRKPSATYGMEIKPHNKKQGGHRKSLLNFQDSNILLNDRTSRRGSVERAFSEEETLSSQSESNLETIAEKDDTTNAQNNRVSSAG